MTRGHWTVPLPLFSDIAPIRVSTKTGRNRDRNFRVNRGRVKAYKIANFLGLTATIGNRKKQMTKHAAAPRLQPEKMRMRSHLLTRRGVSSEE